MVSAGLSRLENNSNSRWKWSAGLVAFILLAGLESIRLGQDGNWDLKNYHYYNVYAWLNGRFAKDIAPAMIQTYHSPFLDVPFYFLVQADLRPRVISFLMAAPTGVAALFLLRIAATLFPRGVEDRHLWIGLAVAVGITGAGGSSVIGSTMNEWPPAAFLIAAVSVLVSSAARPDGPSMRSIAIAGALAGFSVGAKLTYGMFAPALMAAIMTFGSWRERLTRAFALGCAIGAGFLLSYGLWGAILYREFANPFFPYFNTIFNSPYWEPTTFFDRNYGPRTLLQWIFFPFYFAWQTQLVGEAPFRDWRFPVLFALTLACIVKALLKRRELAAPSQRVAATPLTPRWRLVAAFVLVAYVTWLKMFGIYRYLVPLEMLTGPLLVGCALYLTPGKKLRRYAILILALMLIASTNRADWGRLDYRKSYFDITVPELPSNSLVIVGPRHPMAYIIPFLRSDARFVSPSNEFLEPGQRNLLAQQTAELINSHSGPVFSLDFHDQQDTVLALNHFRLSMDKSSCQGIKSNMDSNAMRLCPLQRKR